MANLQEVERLLDHMTAGEKTLVLQRVVRNLGILAPGIESNPAVCGGEPCIVRIRIPVWLLVQLQRLGMSEAELLRNYPSLRAECLANAWAYARQHGEEIEQQIVDNETAA